VDEGVVGRRGLPEGKDWRWRLLAGNGLRYHHTQGVNGLVDALALIHISYYFEDGTERKNAVSINQAIPPDNLGTSIAILFVDVAGSTGLYERLGDANAKRLVTGRLNVLRNEVQVHGGEVVQAIGDELMCRFPNAEAACAAAITMQQCVARHQSDAPLAVKVRIGLHWGEALREGNNLYGDAVNTAARLAHIAQGGQIMTTECVIAQARRSVGGRWRPIGALPLKGKETPIPVCEILWEPEDLADRLAATMITRLPSRIHELCLISGASRIILGPERRSASLGRDQDNDLVLPFPQVSRAHATVECRLDKFYLCDHSTNGTLLVGPDRTPLTLHREEAPLTGSGEIFCGTPQAPDAGCASVAYRIRELDEARKALPWAPAGG
jgi:adenylate cyclase